MRILSIVIKNYRQYRDLKLEFGKPPKGSYNLNVLVGKNGFGKTNLANALCWSLWEKEPDLALKDKNAGKPIFNLAAMEDCRTQRKSGIDVSVSVKIDLENQTGKILMVSRTCHCTEKGFIDEPTLMVVETGRNGARGGTPFTGIEAQEEIERYYPSDLSDYLVFDGERLTTYFQRGQASKIQQSVINLSGIQKLDEAIRHHQIMISELDSQISDNSEELQDADKRSKEAERKHKNNEEEIERYTREVQEAEEAIQNLRENIGNHKNVPDLLARKDTLDARLRQIEQELGKIRDRKCELIRNYYPIFAAMRHAPVLRAYVQQKQKKQEYPPSIKREVFEEILKANQCIVCGEKLSAESREYIKAQIEKYNKTVVSTETYRAINDLIEPKLVAFTERLKVYLERRDGILRDEQRVIAAQEEIEEELQEVCNRLSTVNNAQSYKRMVSELTQREECQRYARDMLGAARERSKQLLQEKLQAEAEYEQIRLRSDSDAVRLRQREILKSSWEIIDATKKKMVDEIRAAIVKKANEYWHDLMWKPSDEIGSIDFDQSFAVSLKDDESGQPLIGTLSAAERVMLALSITWALHSQAGINFPFFIDTPVANMSSDSRKDFAITLKEISKEKQVVLLFTDTEYINEIPEAFGKDLNTYKTLVYSKGKTEIK